MSGSSLFQNSFAQLLFSCYLSPNPFDGASRTLAEQNIARLQREAPSQYRQELLCITRQAVMDALTAPPEPNQRSTYQELLNLALVSAVLLQKCVKEFDGRSDSPPQRHSNEIGGGMCIRAPSDHGAAAGPRAATPFAAALVDLHTYLRMCWKSMQPQPSPYGDEHRRLIRKIGENVGLCCAYLCLHEYPDEPWSGFLRTVCDESYTIPTHVKNFETQYCVSANFSGDEIFLFECSTEAQVNLPLWIWLCSDFVLGVSSLMASQADLFQQFSTSGGSTPLPISLLRQTKLALTVLAETISWWPPISALRLHTVPDFARHLKLLDPSFSKTILEVVGYSGTLLEKILLAHIFQNSTSSTDMLQDPQCLLSIASDLTVAVDRGIVFLRKRLRHCVSENGAVEPTTSSASSSGQQLFTVFLNFLWTVKESRFRVVDTVLQSILNSSLPGDDPVVALRSQLERFACVLLEGLLELLETHEGAFTDAPAKDVFLLLVGFITEPGDLFQMSSRAASNDFGSSLSPQTLVQRVGSQNNFPASSSHTADNRGLSMQEDQRLNATLLREILDDELVLAGCSGGSCRDLATTIIQKFAEFDHSLVREFVELCLVGLRTPESLNASFWDDGTLLSVSIHNWVAVVVCYGAIAKQCAQNGIAFLDLINKDCMTPLLRLLYIWKELSAPHLVCRIVLCLSLTCKLTRDPEPLQIYMEAFQWLLFDAVMVGQTTTNDAVGLREVAACCLIAIGNTLSASATAYESAAAVVSPNLVITAFQLINSITLDSIPVGRGRIEPLAFTIVLEHLAELAPISIQSAIWNAVGQEDFVRAMCFAINNIQTPQLMDHFERFLRTLIDIAAVTANPIPCLRVLCESLLALSQCSFTCPSVLSRCCCNFVTHVLRSRQKLLLSIPSMPGICSTQPSAWPVELQCAWEAISTELVFPLMRLVAQRVWEGHAAHSQSSTRVLWYAQDDGFLRSCSTAVGMFSTLLPIHGPSMEQQQQHDDLGHLASLIYGASYELFKEALTMGNTVTLSSCCLALACLSVKLPTPRKVLIECCGGKFSSFDCLDQVPLNACLGLFLCNYMANITEFIEDSAKDLNVTSCFLLPATMFSLALFADPKFACRCFWDSFSSNASLLCGNSKFPTLPGQHLSAREQQTRLLLCRVARYFCFWSSLLFYQDQQTQLYSLIAWKNLLGEPPTPFVSEFLWGLPFWIPKYYPIRTIHTKPRKCVFSNSTPPPLCFGGASTSNDSFSSILQVGHALSIACFSIINERSAPHRILPLRRREPLHNFTMISEVFAVHTPNGFLRHFDPPRQCSEDVEDVCVYAHQMLQWLGLSEQECEVRFRTVYGPAD